jgi:hypothetical protein
VLDEEDASGGSGEVRTGTREGIESCQWDRGSGSGSGRFGDNEAGLDD